jgi:hypothetical protein
MYGVNICKHCDGFGFFVEIRPDPVPNSWFCLCLKCGGTGKIDWIQEILQREPRRIYVGDVIEKLYYKETGKFVVTDTEKVEMMAYFYDKCKVYYKK